MQKLLELANKIEDKELRKKVTDYLKNPTPTHKDFKKYPEEDLEKARTPFVVGGTPALRDVLNHTTAVTETCINVAEALQKNFGIKLNRDVLIAGALLHDVMKLFEWKMTKEGPEHTGLPLDHTLLGVAELYRREFPEEVIHMVASHPGEAGTTQPRTAEAFLLHQVDNMLSIIEHNAASGSEISKKQIPVLILDEETLQKIKKSSEDEKK